MIICSDIYVISFISIDNKTDYSHALPTGVKEATAALSLFSLRKKWSIYVASKL